jgi:plastocyanin
MNATQGFRFLAATAALFCLGAVISSAQGLPTSAVMHLGNTGTGSPFPPPEQHDRSVHAADKMVPRNVTIAVGGTVTFVLNTPIHGMAIYAPGTKPSDIHTGLLQGPFGGCPPVPFINDGTNRLATFAAICAGGNAANQFQFNAPGRYLIICTFLPHFTDGDMYAWVIVGEEKGRGPN